MSAPIHEFDPQIYPCRLWIAVSHDTFADRFEGVSEWDETADAIVDKVHDKTTKKGGLLIRFADKKAMTTDHITHEASHVAIEIFDYIGANVDATNHEPFAYLCGWIAKCIDKVKRLKTKPTKH